MHLINNNISCWATNAHTPNPLKASVIPIIPDITAEVMLVKAIFLNLISIVSFVSGTDMKAEIINCRDKTLNKRTNDGSL